MSFIHVIREHKEEDKHSFDGS